MNNIEELKEKMKTVPFGNSQFQIVNFIANEHTPERAYRSILLQLNQKLKTMQECSFRRRNRELDIEEIEENMKDKNLSYLEQKRLQIDLEEAEYHLDEEIKFIEDCAIEIKTYEALLSKLPEYTREQFEKSERLYWEKRLIKEIETDIKATGLPNKGVIQSLNKLGISLNKTSNGQILFNGNIENKEILGLIENN